MVHIFSLRDDGDADANADDDNDGKRCNIKYDDCIIEDEEDNDDLENECDDYDDYNDFHLMQIRIFINIQTHHSKMNEISEASHRIKSDIFGVLRERNGFCCIPNR